MGGAGLGVRGTVKGSSPHLDGQKPRRLAAIDIGTNSIRLVVAKVSADGSYKVMDDEREVTRLGAGLAQTGRLSREAMENSAQAIARMRRVAHHYDVDQLAAVATCAVREAANGGEFLDLVHSRCGISVSVIPAEFEGRLAFRSVAGAFDLSTSSVGVLDIGGGSTEVVLSQLGEIDHVDSLPLGAVRLTELFPGVDNGAELAFARMSEWVRAQLRELVGKPAYPVPLVIGTGGTFTSLARLAIACCEDEHAAQSGSIKVRGYELELPQVADILNWLRRMPLRARAHIPGLSRDRAGIIVAGVAIVHAAAEHLGAKRVRVHDGGIRDGLIMAMIEGEEIPSIVPASTGSRPRSADRLARAAAR